MKRLGPVIAPGRARLVRTGAWVAAAAVVAVLAAGCKPIAFTSSGGGAATGSCLTGTWKLDTQNLSSGLATAVPGLTVTASGPGVTLTLSDTAWTLHADQTLAASISTSWGDAHGTIHVTGDAHGSYSSGSASAITFTLAGLTGTADYTISALGHDFSGSLSLPASGLEKLYGLSGTATQACGASGLTLTFPTFSMHAHH
ncbi:MAG TPA: hypothetical protein VN636_03980 [Acidimicrobiia bacterium]|nr:hypothetical protein [Acidimicrobiia bacterium]